MTINKRIYANNAKTTLASQLTPTDTTIQVANGSIFPAPTNGQFFLVTIESGNSVEVIRVNGRAGNTFLNCVRGQENTSALAFAAGTKIENRATRDTFASFARLEDRLADIDSVNVLDTPGNSDANSYLCHSLDDGGNPTIAVKNGELWRFLNYPQVFISSTVSNSTAPSASSIASSFPLNQLTTPYGGKYIIQFTTGANKGLCRPINSATSTVLSWTTALPAAPAVNDGFELYKSQSCINNELTAALDDGLIFAIIMSN